MSRELLHTMGLLAVAFILAAGQLLFKVSADRVPLVDRVSDLRHLLLDPVLWAALVLYGVATVLWVLLLQRVQLTYAYPFAALAFVLVPFGAAVFFGEKLNPSFFIGAALIIAGICVTGASRT